MVTVWKPNQAKKFKRDPGLLLPFHRHPPLARGLDYFLPMTLS